MVERWIAIGAPLLGAGSTLPFVLGGTKVPLKWSY
jgi:hypothetical protein